MINSINLSFEEFKVLKEEAREYTAASFRDLQIVVGIITLFLSFMVTKKGTELPLPLFWQFWIAQTVIFLFLLTVTARVIYLQAIRRRLVSLERELNDECQGRAKWESEIVPCALMSWRSPSLHSLVILAASYAAAFAYFIYRASGETSSSLFYAVSGLEIVGIGYLAIRSAVGYRTERGENRSGSVANEPNATSS